MWCGTNWISRRGWPTRITGSTRCAGFRQSSAARWCTASSRPTSPPGMLRVLATPPPGSRPASLPGAVGPREVWNGEQLRRRRRQCAGSARRSRYSDCRQPVEVADDARQGHTGQAAQLRDRPAVDGIGCGVERRRRPGRGRREIGLLEAVDHGAALEREAAAHRVDARVGRGEPRRDVESEHDAGAIPPAACQPRRNRPGRRLRRRGSPLAPSPGCGARASTRDRGSRRPRP